MAERNTKYLNQQCKRLPKAAGGSRICQELDASPWFKGRLDLPFLLIPAPKMCCDLSNWAHTLSLQRTMKKGKQCCSSTASNAALQRRCAEETRRHPQRLSLSHVSRHLCCRAGAGRSAHRQGVPVVCDAAVSNPRSTLLKHGAWTRPGCDPDATRMRPGHDPDTTRTRPGRGAENSPSPRPASE
jgi:hypothetical protein